MARKVKCSRCGREKEAQRRKRYAYCRACATLAQREHMMRLRQQAHPSDNFGLHP